MDTVDVPLPDVYDMANELSRHHNCQDQLFQVLQQISSRMNTLSLPAPSVPVPPQVQLHPLQSDSCSPDLHLPTPPQYNDNSKSCRAFLIQCTIHFEVMAHKFSLDKTKMPYIVFREALAWASSLWELNDLGMSHLQ